MRLIPALLLAGLLFLCPPVHATELPVDIGRTTLNSLIDRAMARNMVAGAVAVIGNRDGILYSAARGRLSASPDSPAITEHTIFDLASLTKVIATAPSVMKLIEEGRINLNDPITRWFPEFKGSKREDITIRDLLTHTSGLDDNNLSVDQPMKMAINRAATQKFWCPTGTNFQYADINFILLGELVHRVSGKPLDVFARENLFEPLGARETMFLPPKSLSASIAPTDECVGGVVQDRNARRLGGVAGHAGLFGSAYDLSKFARMMLGGGSLDGARIFSEPAVTLMTTPISFHRGAVIRALGWDMNSAFSAPKGNYFSGASYGHTGYSGTSIWIDPKQDVFVILLTIRLDYRDVRAFNQFRRDVSTFAATDFWQFQPFLELPPLETLADANFNNAGRAELTQITVEPQVKHAFRYPQQKKLYSKVTSHKKGSHKKFAKASLKRKLANNKKYKGTKHKLS